MSREPANRRSRTHSVSPCRTTKGRSLFTTDVFYGLIGRSALRLSPSTEAGPWRFPLVEHADVIVIGAGGLGAATAFYLVERGSRNVVLIDKYDIGSQTSPRAAGMVNCVRK